MTRSSRGERFAGGRGAHSARSRTDLAARRPRRYTRDKGDGSDTQVISICQDFVEQALWHNETRRQYEECGVMKYNECPESMSDFDPYQCGDDLVIPTIFWSSATEFMNYMSPPGEAPPSPHTPLAHPSLSPRAAAGARSCSLPHVVCAPRPARAGLYDFEFEVVPDADAVDESGEPTCWKPVSMRTRRASASASRRRAEEAVASASWSPCA